MNVQQLLMFVAFTTATVKTVRSLECYKCNASWSASMCLRNSRIETCPHQPESVCMAIDASVTNLKGEKSILFVRQCASKSECSSSQPCKDIKLHLWRERPGLLVEPDCRPQCCSSDHCNHPVPTPNLPKSSTRKILPTSITPPKKCFEFEPEFVSKLPGRKPREKKCSKYGEFDSCFTLQAQVINVTTRKVTETAEWKDCAMESRDCHAIANRCTTLRELLKSRGADVANCRR
ncbi:hypothetical protein OS493_003577 [Desmophyllum pertusum]|uniref:Uncharacterized protein n=1 Tax=Desmophyllum pertusum TaxID=174260 RepID=A0A9X0A6A6_9CNID|nr:hypothetical protein OS493_003577 [Desmophyllum pertusum]